ncbi:6-bladed beta-propeller [Candidatus Palauibacter sp.]|uniref:6-bladed beta-propeller n=1 Tax=Candidatus Palauibacter sp. TaxID=3101350 RepID=UPI003B02D7EC
MFGKKRGTPRAMSSSILITAACAALAGCGEPASETGWATVRDTMPSGALRVTNIPPSEASPTWTLVEELRVGTVEGAGPDAFAYLKGLVVLEDGRFAVLDSQAQELRVFGPDGAHIATHGGSGEGPGEFANANGLMLDPQGRIWVPDTRNGRMSVFDAEEGFVESFPFADGNFGWIWNGAMVDGTRIYRPWSSGNRKRLHVYDLAMARTDSLPLPDDRPQDEEYDPSNQPGAFYQETGGGYMMYGIPFYPSEIRYIDPRGAFWSTPGGDPQYRIKRWRPGRDTTLFVETRRPAVPVPAVERDSVINVMTEMTSAMGVGEWDWSRVPTIKPAVEDIFQSAEGNVWVRTPSGGDAVLFDVYSGDGAYLGTASLGPGLNLFTQIAPVVRGDLIWMVATDELDVPYAIRARIVPANGGGR